MKQKILRESDYPMLKLIFRATEELLWLSIDTAVYDKGFVDIASRSLNKPMHKKLCEELCEKVDEIYNINENKEKIKSVIKQFDKEGKRLPILTMSIMSQNVFDKDESKFKHQVIPRISLCKEVQYIQDENQFEKLYDVFVRRNGNDGLNMRMFDLVMDIYIESLNREYDIFSVLDVKS